MTRLFISLTLLYAYSYAFSATETPVKIVPLAAPLDQAKAEISGLTWCGDKLILLPQYPKRLGNDGKSYFYYLQKQQIFDFLDSKNSAPLKAKPILVNEKDVRKAVTIFDGFEAIACDGESVWLSIEAINLLGTYQSFIVPGKIDFDEQATLDIDETELVHIKSQSEMRNKGDEAILLHQENVIAIHEVNDPRVVAKPKARYFIGKAKELTAINFPALPYRITDATALDVNNRFWAINYKYSGDKFSRKADDKLAARYGQGESHKRYYNAERLLEFQFSADGIQLIEQAPIQLKMENVEGRNWEGLVRLDDRGFLLATDKHPSTLLGFVSVPMPKKSAALGDANQALKNPK